MHFCGPCHGPGVAHGTINACFYEPTAGVILLALAVLQAVWQIRRLRLLERYQFEPSSQTVSGEFAIVRWTALHCVYYTLFLLQAMLVTPCYVRVWRRATVGHVCLALYAALAATHLFTFIFELVTDGGPPFAAVYDATLLSAWGVALVRHLSLWRAHCSTTCRHPSLQSMLRARTTDILKQHDSHVRLTVPQTLGLSRCLPHTGGGMAELEAPRGSALAAADLPGGRGVRRQPVHRSASAAGGQAVRPAAGSAERQAARHPVGGAARARRRSGCSRLHEVCR